MFRYNRTINTCRNCHRTGRHGYTVHAGHTVCRRIMPCSARQLANTRAGWPVEQSPDAGRPGPGEVGKFRAS